jgi:hypothetical protein
MKLLAFIVFLLVVLWFVRNVHEGATNPPPTDKEIYDILRRYPDSTISDIIIKLKNRIEKLVYEMSQLKTTELDYDKKKSKLQEEHDLKESHMEKLNTIPNEHQKKVASLYISELIATNPNMI